MAKPDSTEGLMGHRVRKSEMLQTGIWILSLWCLGNIGVGITGLYHIGIMRRNAPVIEHILSESMARELFTEVLELINGLDLLLNGALVSIGLQALVFVWKGIGKGRPWAYWAVFFGLGIFQVATIRADQILGNPLKTPILFSTAVLAFGLILCFKDSALPRKPASH